MAVSSCSSFSTIIPFECRSSPDFQIPFGSARSNGSKSKSPNPTATVFHGLSSSLIMRFPPNFVRQLSIKARRNCSNIGVAQVVAASWSNNLPKPNTSSSAANNKAAVDAVTGSLTTPVVDELVIDNDVNCNDNGSVVQIGIEEEVEEKGVFEPRYGGFLSSDGSIAIHAGERVDRALITDSITTPVVNTSAYSFKKTANLLDFKEKRAESFEYGRYGNYTTLALEKKMSALEGAESTIIMASGMCASTVLLMALIPAGGHLVTTTDCYRKTRMFIENFLPKMGITSTVIDPADIKGLESALDKHKVSLFFTESPTNPFLRCVDIELVSKLCHDKGALVCIDGTFATPINQKALALGADIVVHSLTKFIAGHNDVLAGSISGPEKLISVVRNLHHILGGAINPNAAYLILRGMKTLHLRVKQHNSTAQKMAELLEAHPKITRVYYPGLASHPEHSLAKKQMSGFGGVVSFEVDGDLDKTAKFVDALRIPYIAPSFGGAESIVDQPAIMSYWDLPRADRAKYGILDNLVRFSFGLEDFEDLKADVLQALKTI